MKGSKSQRILAGLIFIEILLLFGFRKSGTLKLQFFCSSISFPVSMLIGLFLLYIYRNKKITPTTHVPAKASTRFVLGMSAVVVLLAIVFTNHIIHTFSFSGYSDIIPNIQILAQRFIDGKVVYAKEAWLETTQGAYYPFYLPMHWLPFVISQKLQTDPRWVPMTIWCMAALVVMIRSRKVENTREIYFPALLFAISYILMVFHSPPIIGATIEPVMIGYYMLFIVALNQKNPILTGIVFTCCLLSRYYIATWLPLWLFVMFASRKWKPALFTIVVTIAAVSAIYILPFVSRNVEILSSIGNGYNLGVVSEWTKNMNWFHRPFHLFEGNGFAYLVYEHYKHGDLMAGFLVMKILLLTVPALAVLVMGIWYWFNRKKIDYRIFLMASFKIYLTVFLNLLMVPYTYLFSISVFLSIAIFSEQARYVAVERAASE